MSAPIQDWTGDAEKAEHHSLYHPNVREDIQILADQDILDHYFRYFPDIVQQKKR